MKPVHVFQLIDGLNIGGAEVLLRDLVAGLVQRGYRLSVGYMSDGPILADLVALGVRIIHLPHAFRVDPMLLHSMMNAMRSDPPHLVHTHLFKSDFHGRIAARMAGVPVVFSTLHNADAWARRWPLGRLYGATAAYTDRMIAVSEEVRDYHVSKTGIDPKKVVVIPNGVDVSRFTNREADGLKVRAEFNISSDAILFGIIGRFRPQKDHINFLKAAAAIHAQMPDARFLVVGDGELRPELEKLASQLGLLPSLVFAGLRSDIPAILAALDVMVISSRWEGLPVALLEGMAAGKPVVATAVDGIRGVAEHDVTGLLVPPSDSSALATACVTLAHDPALRERMGKAGHRKVSLSYSLDSMLDRTAGLYNEMLRLHGMADMIPGGSEAREMPATRSTAS